MKHCVIPAALAALLLLAASAHATAVEDSLAAMSDSARVALVFPFEVGQVYQFKASGDFTRPNGEVLPAYTVAEVTITDTVIGGVTWLKIPYWSPFGTELYRLDENLQVQMWMDEWQSERFTLDLKHGEWPAMGGNCVKHFPFSYEGSELLAGCGPKAAPRTSWGWLLCPPDSSQLALMDALSLPYHTWGVQAMHGALGEGSCVQGTGNMVPATDRYRYVIAATWAVFRAKTEGAWPELDPMGTTDVARHDEGEAEGPTPLALRAYPNPFNPSLTLAYTVPTAGDVHIEVYNIAGQRIRTLLHDHVAAGTYSTSWDGLDASGRRAGSGIYFMRLTAGGEIALARATLLR